MAIISTTTHPSAAFPHALPATTSTLRIASLAPNLTQSCFALGLGPDVVCVTDYCKFPPEAAALPKAGGLFNSNTELVLSLRPSLILTQSRSLSGIDRLRASDTEVAVMPCESLAQIDLTLAELGRRGGPATTVRAEALRARVNAELAAVRVAVAGRPRPRALLVFGHPPGQLRDIGCQGGTGFLHELLETAGARNALTSTTAAYVTASRETLIADPPDLVIEMRGDGPAAGWTTADADRLRALWADTLGPARPAGSGAPAPRVEFAADPLLAIAGPEVGHTARVLARLIHPGAPVPAPPPAAPGQLQP